MTRNPNNYPCEFDGYELPEMLQEETPESRERLEEKKEQFKMLVARIKAEAQKREKVSKI